MTTLSELVADATHLRAWLESLPPDEWVGTKGDLFTCPVGVFLAEASDCSWSGIKRVEVRAPALLRFMVLVDRTRMRLTARKCLRLLGRAEREVGG